MHRSWRFFARMLVSSFGFCGVAAAVEPMAPAAEPPLQGLYFGLESKLTALAGSTTAFVGAQVGWTLNDRFVLGIAGYAPVRAVYPRALSEEGGRLRMFYGNLRAGYVVTPEAPVHLIGLLLFGAGGASVEKSAGASGEGTPVFMLEPALELELAPPAWRLFRAGLGVSYRAVALRDVGGLNAADLSRPTASAFARLGWF
jgi:hypothetical protein